MMSTIQVEGPMLKRLAFVGVLAFVGLVAGIAITGLGGLRVEIGSTLYLPAHDSPHTSSELVAMIRGHHPGAQVWAHGRGITIEASGSFADAEHAMRLAYGELVANNDRKFKSYYPDFADQVGFTWGNRFRNGLLGLLAGISVALGFLVPPTCLRVVSVQTPTCRCGQLWEAHRCPRPPRRSLWKLGVLGGVAGLILTVAAGLVVAALLRPAEVSTSGFTAGHLPAGPVQPRLQACMMFYRWEGTQNTNYLNQAVADAHSPRVPRQSKLRFMTDLSGLRSSTRQAIYARSPTIINYEHAIQTDCNRFTAGLNSRDRPRFRRAFVRLSRLPRQPQ
jgi:hypothetical protein